MSYRRQTPVAYALKTCNIWISNIQPDNVSESKQNADRISFVSAVGVEEKMLIVDQIVY